MPRPLTTQPMGLQDAEFHAAAAETDKRPRARRIRAGRKGLERERAVSTSTGAGQDNVLLQGGVERAFPDWDV